MTRLWLAIPAAVVLVAAVGCGDSEGPRSTSAGPPAGAEVRASDDEDIQIGADLKRYLIRNCPAPGTKPSVPKEYRNSRYFSEIRRLNIGTIAFCESIATIEVDDGRVMVRTDLKENARGRAAGEGFCLLVQGSDVADFTPGHELQDIKGETIKVCEARTA